jgi:hypothetical protein
MPAQVRQDVNDFYVYVLLDSRKGSCKYGKYRFEHEPFYVGKGKGGRLFSHFNNPLRLETINKLKLNIIRKIQKETGELPSYRVFKCVSEKAAFDLEKRLIAVIGRRDLKEGPLANHTNGGEGCVGYSWSRVQRAAQAERTRSHYASLSDEQKEELRAKKLGHKGGGSTETKYTTRTYSRKLKETQCGKWRLLGEYQGARIKHNYRCTDCASVIERLPWRMIRSNTVSCIVCKKADPDYQSRMRKIRSDAAKKAGANRTQAQREKISKNLSAAIKRSWTSGKLSEKRI